jgi:hypothetical protein
MRGYSLSPSSDPRFAPGLAHRSETDTPFARPVPGHHRLALLPAEHTAYGPGHSGIQGRPVTSEPLFERRASSPRWRWDPRPLS